MDVRESSPDPRDVRCGPSLDRWRARVRRRMLTTWGDRAPGSPMILLLTACSPPPYVDTADSVDSGDTGDSADTGAAGTTYDDVVFELVVADRTEGFDLDGDGATDNAIWSTGELFDPVLADGLAMSSLVSVFEVTGVDDLAEDDDVEVALRTAADPDGDAGDNGSGDESFDTSGVTTTPSGAALSGGEWYAVLVEGGLSLGTFTLPIVTPIAASGELSDAGEAGLVGFGVDVATLVGALDAAGQDGLGAALEVLADLDLDDDGTAETLSMAFVYTAAPCTLED